jgi:hypothetical protein
MAKALLINNRSIQEADIHEAMAVTATGWADMKEFVSSPTCLSFAY